MTKPSAIHHLPSPIALVVFDLGRVLLRIADDWDDAFRRAGLEPVVSLKGDISAATRREHTDHEGDLFTDFETGRIPPEVFFDHASRTSGLSPQQVQRVLEAWLIEPFPGVDALLDDLAQRNIRTACLSNTNAHHWAMMTDPSHPAYLPIDRLTYPLASQLIGHAKPHDACYAHVEQATATAPPHILFFDDLPENTQAAQQRGWQARLIDKHHDPIAQCRKWLAFHRVL